MEMISNSMIKSVPVEVAQRKVTNVSFYVTCFFTTVLVQFYKGAVKLGEVSVSSSVLAQLKSIELDLTGVTTLTVKTNTNVILLDRLNFDWNVGFTFPGLSILNFRWLPEAISPSVVAADFDYPSRVVINANGISSNGIAQFPFVHDSYIALIELKAVQTSNDGVMFRIEFNTDVMFDFGVEPKVAPIVGTLSGEIYTVGDGSIIQLGRDPSKIFVSIFDPVAVNAFAKQAASVVKPTSYFKLRGDQYTDAIVKRILVIGWDNP